MSYGSEAEVASRVRHYASVAGVFDADTRPSLAQVTSWLAQVSGLIDAILDARGYSTPVTEANLNNALDLFTNDEVAAMCEGANGSGRFGPRNNNVAYQSQHEIIMRDVVALLDTIAKGNPITAGSIATTRTDGWS